MKKLFLATALTMSCAVWAVAQTSNGQSGQTIPPRDPPLGKWDMGPKPDTMRERNPAAGTQGLSRGTVGRAKHKDRRHEER